jgi:hypothetical protein
MNMKIFEFHFSLSLCVQRLYQVCTSSSRACMSLKDLVCCLALIYYGTTKERMQRKRFFKNFH